MGDVLRLDTSNASSRTTRDLLPAAGMHTHQTRSLFHLLAGRGFNCPANTHSCAKIGHPNLCCDIGDTCVDTTSSGVGCCPAGETCGEEVAGCDTRAGYTSCPESPDGGCCLPGAQCDGLGCIFYGTHTVVTTLPTTTTTQSRATSVSAASDGSSSQSTASVTTTTTTVTQSGSVMTRTITVVVSGVGASSSTSTTTSTVTPGPPLRPTSISSSSAPSSPAGGCPTGYYMCSAYYQDCCQVGRDCDTTSCPPQSHTTVLSNGPTVAVSGSGAAGASTATAEGTCAHGWALCPAAVDGGCCPSGYLCGTSSCSATVSGEDNTGKMAPSGATVVRWTWAFGLFTVVAGGLMVAL